MKDTSKFHNYCYKDNKPSCAYAYLWPTLLKLLPKNKRFKILDFGCGNGSFAHLIAQRRHEVVGIDYSESGIELARKNFPECNFIKANIYDLPYEKLRNSFDIIFSIEVIEHLFYPRELMKTAKQCLKSKGLFILTTPYHGYLKNLIIAILGKTDTHFGSTVDGGHIKFFSKNTIYHLLRETGFKPVKFYGSGRFLFLWKSMIIVAQKI